MVINLNVPSEAEQEKSFSVASSQLAIPHLAFFPEPE